MDRSKYSSKGKTPMIVRSPNPVIIELTKFRRKKKEGQHLNKQGQMNQL